MRMWICLFRPPFRRMSKLKLWLPWQHLQWWLSFQNLPSIDIILWYSSKPSIWKKLIWWTGFIWRACWSSLLFSWCAIISQSFKTESAMEPNKWTWYFLGPVMRQEIPCASRFVSQAVEVSKIYFWNSFQGAPDIIFKNPMHSISFIAQTILKIIFLLLYMLSLLYRAYKTFWKDKYLLFRHFQQYQKVWLFSYFNCWYNRKNQWYHSTLMRSFLQYCSDYI